MRQAGSRKVICGSSRSGRPFLAEYGACHCGNLLEVGRGKMSVEGFRQVIEAKDRGKAGTSAPGHALYLVNVTYPDRLFEV